MRRFRNRRRRLAALALLGAAAATAGPAQPAAAQDGDSTGTSTGGGAARIDTSSRTVATGNTVVLRGGFPGSSKTPIEIRSRATGSDSWRTVAGDRTGASGHYRVSVRPSRTAVWRVELAHAPKTLSSSDSPDSTAPTAASTSGPASAGSRCARGPAPTCRAATRRSATRSPSAARSSRPAARVACGCESAITRERTRTGRDGRFSVRWTATRTGGFPVRVRAGSNGDATGSSDRPGRVTVYRPAAASWYGPGLYGNALACGGTLTPSTLGVANRTLPCGTKLRLRYKGRSVAVRVIDRGPFSGSREFDLTAATKQKLGFPDLGTVLSSR